MEVAVEAVANIVDNSQADIIIEITRAKIHKAAKREDADHDKRNIKKRALILARKHRP